MNNYYIDPVNDHLGDLIVDPSLENYGQAADARIVGIALNKLTGSDLGGVDDKSLYIYTDPDKFGQDLQSGVLAIKGFYNPDNVGKYTKVTKNDAGELQLVWDNPTEGVQELIDAAVSVEATHRKNADTDLRSRVDNKQDILVAGSGINISGNPNDLSPDTISVKIDNDTIAINTAGNLYVPSLAEAATKTFVLEKVAEEKTERIAGDEQLSTKIDTAEAELKLEDQNLQSQIDTKADKPTTENHIYWDTANKKMGWDLYDRIDGDTSHTGSVIIGDIANNSASDFSLAEGKGTTASGEASHAEGEVTKAIGKDSHAEGKDSYAYGLASHAEGVNSQTGSSVTAGEAQHAEGIHTIANSNGSHAEGFYTSANRPYQHVQGKYNSINSESDTINLVDIVGWGNSEGDRANIEATDNTGNKILHGDVFVHADNQSNGGTRLWFDNDTIVYDSTNKAWGINNSKFVDKTYVDTQDQAIKDKLIISGTGFEVESTAGAHDVGNVLIDDSTIKVDVNNKLYTDFGSHVDNSTVKYNSSTKKLYANTATLSSLGVVSFDNESIVSKNADGKLSVNTDDKTIKSTTSGIHVNANDTLVLDSSDKLGVNVGSTLIVGTDGKINVLDYGNIVKKSTTVADLPINDGISTADLKDKILTGFAQEIAGDHLTYNSTTKRLNVDEASDSQMGVVKIDNDTIYKNAAGQLTADTKLNNGIATAVTTSGTVKKVDVQVDGVTVEVNSSNKLHGLYTAGDGLTLTSADFSVNTNAPIKIDSDKVSLDYDSNSLEVNASDKLEVKDYSNIVKKSTKIADIEIGSGISTSDLKEKILDGFASDISGNHLTYNSTTKKIDADEASDTQLGVVKFDNDTIYKNAAGQLTADTKLNNGTGTTVTTSGTVKKVDINTDNITIKVNSSNELQGLYTAGDGLTLTSADFSVNTNAPIKIDSDKVSLDYDSNSLEVNASDKLAVKDYNKLVQNTRTVAGLPLSADIAASDLSDAIVDEVGATIAGDNLVFEATTHTLNVPSGSTSTLGVVKIDGDSVFLNSSGQVAVNKTLAGKATSLNASREMDVQVDDVTIAINASNQLKGLYTAGDGLTLTSADFSVNTNAPIKIDSDKVSLSYDSDSLSVNASNELEVKDYDKLVQNTRTVAGLPLSADIAVSDLSDAIIDEIGTTIAGRGLTYNSTSNALNSDLASDSQLGIVKVDGATISADTNGVISVIKETVAGNGIKVTNQTSASGVAERKIDALYDGVTVGVNGDGKLNGLYKGVDGISITNGTDHADISVKVDDKTIIYNSTDDNLQLNLDKITLKYSDTNKIFAEKATAETGSYDTSGNWVITAAGQRGVVIPDSRYITEDSTGKISVRTSKFDSTLKTFDDPKGLPDAASVVAYTSQIETLVVVVSSKAEDTPAGVTWVDEHGTTIVGTLSAESTEAKDTIFLIKNGLSYLEYLAVGQAGSKYWVCIGGTDIDLTQYVKNTVQIAGLNIGTGITAADLRDVIVNSGKATEYSTTDGVIDVLYDDSTIKLDSSNKLYVNSDNFTIKTNTSGKLGVNYDDVTINAEASGKLFAHTATAATWNSTESAITANGSLGVTKPDGRTLKIDSSGYLYARDAIIPTYDASGTQLTSGFPGIITPDGVTLVKDATTGYLKSVANGKDPDDATIITNTSDKLEVNIDNSSIKYDATNKVHVNVDGKSIVNGTGGLEVSIDDSSIKLDSSNKLSVNYDNSTIKPNASGKLGVEYDDKTIKLNSSNKLSANIDKETLQSDGTTGTLYARKATAAVWDSSESSIITAGKFGVTKPDGKSLQTDANGYMYARDSVLPTYDGTGTLLTAGKAGIVIPDGVTIVKDATTGYLKCNVTGGGTPDDKTIIENGLSQLTVNIDNNSLKYDTTNNSTTGSYVNIDDATLKYDTTNGIAVDIDAKTLVHDSTDKLHVNIDEKSLVYNSTDNNIVVNIDDDSIKLDSSNKLSVNYNGTTIYKDSDGKLAVHYDNSTLKASSAGVIYARTAVPATWDSEETTRTASGSLGVIKPDGKTIKSDSDGYFYVRNAILPTYDGTGTQLTSGKAGVVIPDGKTLTVDATTGYLKSAIDSVTPDGTTIVKDSSNKISANVDNSSIKYDSTDKLHVNIDGETIINGTNGLEVAIDNGSIRKMSSGELYTKLDEQTLICGADGLTVNVDGSSIIFDTTKNMLGVYYDDKTIKEGSFGIETNIDKKSLVYDTTNDYIKVNSDDKTIKLNASDQLEVQFDDKSIKLDADNKLCISWGTW